MQRLDGLRHQCDERLFLFARHRWTEIGGVVVLEWEADLLHGSAPGDFVSSP